ncbi:MAG: hypothetical protein L0H55_11100 [Candidatus Nitrosocosmicus sp.]|nr:hypothetical protein [Candidatus Nitrosocosmicus sp.]
MSNSNSFPLGYHSVNPYILVNNALDFFLFLESVFGASIIKKIENNDDVYLEAKIGDMILMIEQQKETISNSKVYLWIYLKDIEYVYDMAIKAGCITVESPSLKFGTDRVAKIIDPFGVTWYLSSYIPRKD